MPTVNQSGRPLYIEDFWQAGDVSWSAAFDRAQATYMTPEVGSPRLDARRFLTQGRWIIFGRDQETYEFDRPIDSFGAQLLGLHDSVTLQWTVVCDGIISHFPRYFTGEGGTHPSGYGGRTELQNLNLLGKRGVKPDGMACDGVRAHCHIDARNTYVYDFEGRGWYITADVRRPDKSNSNRFILTQCRAFDCGSDGFRIDGGDVSAGQTILCMAQMCDGWGLDESSFLGNKHDAFSSVLCGTGPRVNTVPEVQLAINCDSRGGRSVFNNPYVEGYGALVKVLPPSKVYGGNGGLYDPLTPRDTGGVHRGQTDFWGPTGYLRVGANDSVFDFGPARVGDEPVQQPYSMQHEGGFYRLELARANSQRALSFTTDKSMIGARKLRPGRTFHEAGTYHGSGAICHSYGSGAPPAYDAANPDHVVGSRWSSTTPVVGQPADWMLANVNGVIAWRPLNVVG